MADGLPQRARRTLEGGRDRLRRCRAAGCAMSMVVSLIVTTIALFIGIFAGRLTMNPEGSGVSVFQNTPFLKAKTGK